MGRGTRWLCLLFCRKKADSDGSTAASEPAKEKRRCELAKSSLEQWMGEQSAETTAEQKWSHREEQSAETTAEQKWSHREAPRSFVAGDDEQEQNKRAIAVAAATAAVAEAAVAAAQEAAAVVRLTGSGRAAASKQEAWAAIKIQAAFRGYLARRALKALKGLVKLQALVRGNIVRKQAAETLRCMQALVRVQARARACRVLRSGISRFERGPISHSRASSKSIAADASVWDSTNSGGWNWLDGWMEERYRDSHGSFKKKGNGGPVDDEKDAKILEVDPGVHQKKRTAHNQSYSTLTLVKNSHCFANLPDSPSMESSAALQFASCESSIKLQQSLGHLRFPWEPGDFGESPQLCSASSRPGSSRRGPFTPSKSECSRSLFGGFSDNPNYMANTESSRAKWRSHSAPKQRPDRLNSSGSLAQRFSSLHAKSAYRAYPGSGRLDKFGVPISIG